MLKKKTEKSRLVSKSFLYFIIILLYSQYHLVLKIRVRIPKFHIKICWKINYNLFIIRDISKVCNKIISWILEVNNYQTYEKPDTREPSKHGVFDPNLGVFRKEHGDCPTCGKDNLLCTGHFGHIELALPVFHTGYFPHTYNLLQMICKTCSRVLLEDPKDETGKIVKNADKKDSREYFRSRLDNPNISYQRKTALKKEIMAIVKKVPKICPYWWEIFKNFTNDVLNFIIYL